VFVDDEQLVLAEGVAAAHELERVGRLGRQRLAPAQRLAIDAVDAQRLPALVERDGQRRFGHTVARQQRRLSEARGCKGACERA
jgi:hypothetical protein